MIFKQISLRLTICSIILAVPFTLAAQISIDGMIRPRTEFRNGYRLLRTPNTEPALFTSQRTRLRAKYEHDKYSVTLSGQDVRVWGDVEQLQDNANVNIHEAYAELFFSPRVSLQLGRQELVYNNHRLLGNVGWTQQARSHDALRLRIDDTNRSLKLDAGLAFNQERENILGNEFTLNNYKALSYVWFQKEYDALEVSVLGLTDGFQTLPDVTKFRYTYGTQLSVNKDPLHLTAEAYGQSGDDANRSDISAYMWAVDISHTRNRIHLNAGYNFLSGGGADDDNPAGNAFNTLYATNHKFYGTMDYFLNIPADTRNGGLQNLYVKADYSFSELLNLKMDVHYFALADRIRSPENPGQLLDKTLGLEIDTHLSYSFAEDVQIHLGYSTLFPDTSLEAIQGTRNAKDIQHWLWSMLVITPKFLE